MDNQIALRTDLSMAERAFEMAISKDAPLEQLEKFLQLRRDEERYEAEKAYNKAWAEVHAEIPKVIKREYNRQTKSYYEDLSDIITITKPITGAHGFSLTFYEGDSPKEGYVRVHVDISHAQGHTVTRYYDAPPEGKGIQGNSNMTDTHAKGSQITYARRYLMRMILNLPTGKDDDGNGAAPQEYINIDQQTEISDLLGPASGEAAKKWLKWIGADDVAHVLKKDYNRFIIALNQAKSKAGAK